VEDKPPSYGFNGLLRRMGREVNVARDHGEGETQHGIAMN